MTFGTGFKPVSMPITIFSAHIPKQNIKLLIPSNWNPKSYPPV